MKDNNQLFRQYDKFNADTFLDVLKTIHSRFPRCYLFLDKAPQHYKSRRVKDYLEENKNSLIPVYLPTASPEFMMLEGVWNIAKHDLLVLEYYSSFEDFRQRISEYFRTKRFGLNMRNYLLRAV
jgi:transposase